MPQHKHYFARIPLIALLVLLGLAPWLAVILFILRAIDKDAEKKEWRAFQDRRRYTADFRPEDTRRAAQPGPGAPYDYSARYQAHDLPTAEQQKAKKRRQSLINWCTVLGGLFLFAGVTELPDSIYYGLWNDLFSNLFMVVGGGGALVLGLFLRRVSRLERQLDKVVGGRDNIPLNELFAAAGIPEKEGRKVLESAIDHGYFGADAYIDNRTDFLVVRGDAPIPPPPPPARPSPPLPPRRARRSRTPIPPGRPSTSGFCASCTRRARPLPTPRCGTRRRASRRSPPASLPWPRPTKARKSSCANSSAITCPPPSSCCTPTPSWTSRGWTARTSPKPNRASSARWTCWSRPLKTSWTSCSSPTRWTSRPTSPPWKGC